MTDGTKPPGRRKRKRRSKYRCKKCGGTMSVEYTQTIERTVIRKRYCNNDGRIENCNRTVFTVETERRNEDERTSPE